MKKRQRMGLTALVMSVAFASQAGIVLDVDFSHLTPGTTIQDAKKIEDVSGNGYHGFWGDAEGTYNVVNTFNGGVGVDTTTAPRGVIMHRDGLTNIPDAWDGPTTTVSPYFTLEADKDYTFESVVQFGTTDASTAGMDGLMGQVKNTSAGRLSEAFVRVSNGQLQYKFDDGTGNAASEWGIDITSAFDGKFHNVAVVLDRTANEIRSYLDGNLVYTDTEASISNLGAMLDGTADFFTGGYNTTDSAHFNGIADQYRISDTALTTGEMLAVPEPATLGMVAVFGGGMLFIRRRLRL